MRVLVLTHRYPYPPNKGDRIRSFHILRYLASRAEVDLATLCHEPISDEDQRELGKFCRTITVGEVKRVRKWLGASAGLFQGKSLTEGLFKSLGLKRQIAELASQRQYDLVFAFCSSMEQYLNLPELKQVPKVVDLIDVDSEKWKAYAAGSRSPQKQILRRESECVGESEQRLLQSSRAVLVVSEDEKQLLASAGSENCYAIPNGVDGDYYQPSPTMQTSQTQPTCVFVGALDYLPNVEGVLWFSQKVWPQIRQQFPTATFQVVGRQPVKSLLALQAIDGIELFADVPDVRPYLAKANAVVAPLQIARGIQNKVLEAMAMEKLVIATPAAATGIDVQPGEHCLIADASTQWVEALQQAFASVELQQTIGAAARQFVLDHHDWDACLSPLAEIIGLQEPLQKELAQALPT